MPSDGVVVIPDPVQQVSRTIHQPISRSIASLSPDPIMTPPASAIAAWAYFNKPPLKPAVRDDDTTLIDQKNTPGSLRSRAGGTYRRFNGSNQYISFTGRFLQRANTWTVVQFFRTSVASGTNMLWESTFGTSDRNGCSLNGSNGTISFGYYNGSTYTGITTSRGGFNDNRWHCVICENVNTVQKIWVDGTELTAAGSMGNLSATQVHNIGFAANGSFYVPGDFSHYYHFDRTLSAAERATFVAQMLRPWVDAGIPTDAAFYHPLESLVTDRTFGAGNSFVGGTVQNYAAGMIQTDSSAPFSYADLHGYGEARRYDGVDDYHTTSLGGASLPSTGSAEFVFAMNTAVNSAGYYSGMLGSASGRFLFGVNGTSAGSGASKLGIGFQNLGAGNISQGSSSVTAVVGHIYKLKAEWDGANVTFSIDQGSGYSAYRTVAYSGGFASRTVLIGALDNNGSIGNFAPFTVFRQVVRNGAGAIVHDTDVAGFGTPTSSPSTVRTPVLLSTKTLAIGGAAAVKTGPAPFDGTISGFTAGQSVLITGQTITAMPTSGDPVLRNQDVPSPYSFNSGSSGSMVIGFDTAAREGRFHIRKPTISQILSVGNSLHNNAEPKQLIDGGLHFQSTHSNQPLGTIASAPTTNLTSYSYRWDLCLADAALAIDCLVLQPFTADTPNTATTGSSPTFGSELTGARTIIDAAPAGIPIVIFTGWNRQADHATDYTFTLTFVNSSPMVYCPDFFNQFVAQLRADYPGRDIRLCDVLGVYEEIYQDILGPKTYYTAWSQLYSDGTHATATTGRIGNAALRRILKPNGVSYPVTYRGYPWASIATAEADFQDTMVATVIP